MVTTSIDTIALYGSLMRGFGAMEALGIANALSFAGPAVIEGELYDLGDYPGLRPGAERVLAELYSILDVGVLQQLDEFEGVVSGRPDESFYLRKRVRLVEPTGQHAWVYVYNREPTPKARIDSGDWRAYQSARGRPASLIGAIDSTA